MDDTRTLSFDLTDYMDEPHLGDDCGSTSAKAVGDDVDALADARGVLRGLAMALSGWAVVALIALLAM
jgi:hypothetical protein